MVPKLSIITINLNNAPGLRKTMESVISQTSRDFEYIIIDGGSTDGSVEIIKSFTNIPPAVYSPLVSTITNTNTKLCAPCPQPHSTDTPSSFRAFDQRLVPITYWHSEPDSGIYQAMNKGIRVATGEYCQFLNSGDWLVENDVTEKMLKAIPDCSIFYGNMLKVFPNGKILRDICGAGNLTMLSFYLGGMNHSPTYIKRVLFEKYGLYDENFKIVSDWKWYMNVICLNNESLKYINLDVAYFDMGGLSNMNPALDKKERRQVVEELLPKKILVDYDNYWQDILKSKRLKKYRTVKYFFSLTERLLFHFEKLINKYGHYS